MTQVYRRAHGLRLRMSAPAAEAMSEDASISLVHPSTKHQLSPRNGLSFFHSIRFFRVIGLSAMRKYLYIKRCVVSLVHGSSDGTRAHGITDNAHERRGIAQFVNRFDARTLADSADHRISRHHDFAF